MKKQFIAAAIVAMLGLTSCGEAKTSEKTSEKATEATTAEITTEAATTEEITTEAVTESAVPTELSDKYADLDNRSFKYNGKTLTVGVSTLQDIIDAGIEFEKTENYEKMVESEIYYYDEEDDEWYDDYFNGQWVNDFHYGTKDNFATLYFANPYKNEVSMKDCVLVTAVFGVFNDDNPDESKYEFAFPSSLTMDDLTANSGEPTGKDHDSIQYTKVSDLYPEGDSGYDFRFKADGGLNSVFITWIP
ncbi:MAG: hypothetical protein K5898_14435 [Ruminococcus sp.]|uniref:hypothetical protein n=1 Tax=Ruminococcus sp. TaxID=41978 RepID=UPI0025DA51B0|nr:hypothetical protein [Ruminococcus sp.]MCR4796339.1 hypothetical protein [Ruminococcus sp.]